MAKVEIKLDERALHDLLKSTSGPVGQHLFRGGKAVEAAAKRRAPVDTGRLRSSIGTSLVEGADGVEVRVGTDVEYAPYVHDGTRYFRGRPFLDDALREVLGL